MNATMDRDLLNLVQQHVNTLKSNVDQMTFEEQEDRERVSQALKDISTRLEELEARVASLGREQKFIKLEQSSLSKKMVTLEEKVNSAFANRSKYSEGFIYCINYVSVFMKTMKTDGRTFTKHNTITFGPSL